MSAKKIKSEKVLLLRTCNKNMSSAHDPSFIWPVSGPVEAPDWNPDPKIECGHGLHGLLWGDGDWSLLSGSDDAQWMIVAVDTADGIVNGKDKSRFKRGEVVYCGERAGAMTRILCGPETHERNMKEAKEANKKAASSGDSSTAASSGNYSTAASSGYASKAASSGDSSTAASSGNSSTAASSGYASKAASSGYASKAASSGNSSTAASSGNSGIAATLGNSGSAKAGLNGLIIVTWWDEGGKRYRACVGEVGIDGIEADTWYGVVNGKLVKS